MIRLAEQKDVWQLADWAMEIHHREGSDFMSHEDYEYTLGDVAANWKEWGTGFMLVSQCDDCLKLNGCLMIEYQGDNSATGSQLYCALNAPDKLPHQLMLHAGNILMADGIKKITMVTGWSNQHKAFENMGFEPKYIQYSAVVGDVVQALEERLL